MIEPIAVEAALTFYDPETGEITGHTIANQQTINLTKFALTDRYMIDGKHDGNTMYVKDGQAVERPVMQPQVLGTAIANLPIPCTLTVNGQQHECDDGVADFEFDQPGTYTIAISSWPYIDAEVTVENPPQ